MTEIFKKLTHLYVLSSFGKITKVVVTKITDKSVMVGSTRLLFDKYSNTEGYWYVPGGPCYHGGTRYLIPTTELDLNYNRLQDVEKVRYLLSSLDVNNLFDEDPILFDSLLKKFHESRKEERC